MSDETSAWKKYLMTVWAILECALFGGIVYGWVSLVYVLKKEGIYGDICGHGGQNSSIVSLTLDNVTSEGMVSCPEQDEKLQLAFTVATSLMTISSPVMGHIQYAYGTRMARIVLICFFLSGSLTTAFLTTSTPWLIFLAFSCLAIGGMPVIVTNIQVANLFAVGGSTVVGFMAGAFDASAAVQLVFKVAYEHGISRQISYLFISALHTMVIFSTFVLLPRTFIPKVKVDSPSPIVGPYNAKEVETFSGRNDKNAADSKDLKRTEGNPRLIDCALSRIFLSHVGWLSLLQLRMFYFMGTLNPWLNYVTDNNDTLVSYYTNTSLFIQLGGVFTAPFCGFVYDVEKRRHGGKLSVTGRRLLPAVLPLTLTSLFAVLLSGLVLVPSIEVLYVDFAIFTIFRSFLYGTTAAYLQMLFPAEYYGFLYGVMMVISGLVGCLQYPLYIWLEAPPRGPQKVNIFFWARTGNLSGSPASIVRGALVIGNGWRSLFSRRVIAEHFQSSHHCDTPSHLEELYDPSYECEVNIFVLVLTLLSLIHPIHIWVTCRVAEKRRSAENSNTTESEYDFIKKSRKYL